MEVGAGGLICSNSVKTRRSHITQIYCQNETIKRKTSMFVGSKTAKHWQIHPLHDAGGITKNAN